MHPDRKTGVVRAGVPRPPPPPGMEDLRRAEAKARALSLAALVKRTREKGRIIDARV
jgi:hypothetical protein